MSKFDVMRKVQVWQKKTVYANSAEDAASKALADCGWETLDGEDDVLEVEVYDENDDLLLQISDPLQ